MTTKPSATARRAQELEAYIDSLNLRHFRGREFTPYWSSVREGVKNGVPPRALWPNVVPTLLVLDAFRAELGAKVILVSTYRRPPYNVAVGGEDESLHLQFRAIDFRSPKGSPALWAQMLQAMRGRVFTMPLHGGQFAFRGGIGDYPRKGFCHVDTRGYDADWTR